MNRIKHFLIPNRIDSLCTVFAIMAMLTMGLGIVGRLASIGLPDVLIPLMLSFAVCSFAIGAATGWRSCSFRRAGYLTVMFAICPIVVLAILSEFNGTKFQEILSNEKFWDDGNASFGYSNGFLDSITRLTYWLVIIALAFLGGWITVLSFRRVPGIVKRFFTERVKLTRPRFLMVVAGGLLLLGMANNILDSVMKDYQGGFAFVPIVILVSVAVYGTAFWIFVIWPCHWLTTATAWWKKVLVSLFVIGSISVAGWNEMLLLGNGMYPFEFFVSLIASLIYVLTLIGIGTGENRSLAGEVGIPGRDAEIVARSAAGRARLWPSLWSVLLLVGVVVGVSIPFRYDVEILLNTRLGPSRWAAARQSMRVSWISGGDLKMVSESYCFCDFSADTPADVFSKAGLTGPIALKIKNIPPGIDTSSLRNIEKTTVEIGGTCTPKQLRDLAQNCSGFTVISNVDIVGDSEPVEFETTAEVFVIGNSRQVCSVLNSQTSIENVSHFSIHVTTETGDEISADQWLMIVQAGQYCDVLFHLELAAELPPLPASMSMKTIAIPQWTVETGQTSLTANQRWMLEQKEGWLGLEFGSAFDDFDDFENAGFLWDTAFAYPRQLFLVDILDSSECLISEFGFVKSMDRFHWSYGANARNQITDLFLPTRNFPDGLDGSVFQELKSLSFDPMWVVGVRDGQFMTYFDEADLSKLPAMPKLESLFLNPTMTVANIHRLRSFPSLKHLSINADTSLSSFNGQFSGLRQLESLTLYGRPDNATLAEIKTMSSLKRLRIIDLLDEGFAGEPPFDNLQTLFQNCDVERVKGVDYTPEIPERFATWLKSKSNELRAKVNQKTEE